MPVNEPPPHAAFEEAAAAVTGVDAVVFPAAGISAYFAHESQAQSFAGGWTLGCESNKLRSVSAILVVRYCFIQYMCRPSALSAQPAWSWRVCQNTQVTIVTA